MFYQVMHAKKMTNNDRVHKTSTNSLAINVADIRRNVFLLLLWF